MLHVVQIGAPLHERPPLFGPVAAAAAVILSRFGVEESWRDSAEHGVIALVQTATLHSIISKLCSVGDASCAHGKALVDIKVGNSGHPKKAAGQICNGPPAGRTCDKCLQ